MAQEHGDNIRFLLCDEGDSLPRASRPGCAPHTVNVILRVRRDVKVQHEVNVGYVKSPVEKT